MGSSKIYLSIFFLLIFAVFIFEFTRSKDHKSIEFWQYWSGEEQKPLLDLVKSFNEENHGFKVKMQSISLPRKKILMAVAGKSCPDLVHLDGDMVTDFAWRNALINLDPYMDNFEKQKIIPIYLEMLKINGHQYALPLMPNSEAMHINKKLLDQYHLAIPKSLEDIVTISNQVHDPNCIVFLPSWPQWAGRFIPILFGGHWAKLENNEWKITANDPKNIEAWNWLVDNFVKRLGSRHIATFTEGFSAYQSPDNPFYAGKIILENNGVWEYKLASKFAASMEVLIKQFPSKIPGANYVSVDALAIPKYAKHPKQAFIFMTWLIEHSQKLALAQGKFTVYKEEDQDFLAKHPNPYILTFIELAKSPNASYFPPLKFVSRYKRAIKDSYDKVLRLEQSPEQALNELQKSFDPS